MKKLFVLLLLLLCGCSTNYNLSIDSDYVSEDVNIVVPFNLVDEDLYSSHRSQPRVYVNKKYLYNMSISDDDNNYYIDYNFKHNISEFSKSTFISKCFKDVNVRVDGEKIYFKTSQGFYCLTLEDGAYMDKVNFNITTKLKVLDNNADFVNGNTYTWVFDDDNKDKNVMIVMNKGFYNSVSSNVVFVIFFIIGCFVFVIGIFVLYLRKKNVSSNII